MPDPYPFTEVTRREDGAIVVHAESRWTEAHYEITREDAHLLAEALGVSVDRIPEGWSERVSGAGPSATSDWLKDHDIPYRTAFVWMDMDD